MAKSSLSDILAQLSLTNEEEDILNFYLTTMRRKKLSFVFSKTALFIPDLEKSGWIYLELRRIKEVFAWDCSLCENLETFCDA